MTDLSTYEALSGIFGSISLASWIFVLVPQLAENYRLQSADGISLAFLTVWFIGDITNLIGAVWAGLVPTVIALAIYFCFADTILILQCLYYNILVNRSRERKTSTTFPQIPNEEDPLLARQSSIGSTNSSIGLPGSHTRRRSSAASRRRSTVSQHSLARILEEGEGNKYGWARNTGSVVLVAAVGLAGWWLAYRAGVWKPAPSEDDVEKKSMALGAQILGYVSAVCYLGARIPQIVKNQRERSCEGLSLLFFILSLMGNATYGAGILFHSTEAEYVKTNLPWLIGSIGTMAEDIIIFIQFHAFRNSAAESLAVE